MFCQSCGAKIDDGTKFCSSCGTPVEMPQIQVNSTTNVANITVTCQGCLFNNNGKKCTYYACAVSEAEKYECRMRGAPELQKKLRNRNVIFVIAAVFFVVIFQFLPPDLAPVKAYQSLSNIVPTKIAELLGVEQWIGTIIFVAIILTICFFIDNYRNKKKRENAKRLS